MFLEIEPVYIRTGYVFSKAEIDVANRLHQLTVKVTTHHQFVARQVAAARKSLGSLQPIWMFTGNQIDHDFRAEVARLQFRGEFPADLMLSKSDISPDLRWKRIGWDITTAEQGRHHYYRDVVGKQNQWDAYFVLAY